MSIGNELRWILVVGGTILLAAIYWWGRRNDRREGDSLPQRSEPPVSYAEDRVEESVDDSMEVQDAHFTETVTIDEVSWRSSPASVDELPEVHVREESSSTRLRREPVMSDDFEDEAESFAPAAERAAPKLSDEPPSRPAAAPAARETAAAPAASAQRKIFALRLSVANNGLRGEQLLGLLQGAHLEHGKFGVFHRMEANASVFSVASMVEPGSFDLATMEQTQYPGVTLFMLLPGPVDALMAFDQMLNFGRRLEQATGGVLQDERGRALTLHALQKVRDELLDFQHLHGG